MKKEALTGNVLQEEHTSIYQDRKFILFFFTFLASSFSVSFFMFTVNWYVVDYLQLEAMLGIVMFASSVPRVIFMLVGGAIADRSNRAWIMFLSDFSKGLLLIGVVTLCLVDLLSIWILIALGLLFGLLDAFFWPASSSMLPTILKKDQLTRGNSVIDTARNISVIIGPLLAGMIIGFGSYALMFTIVSVMLIISAVIDLILKKRMDQNHESEQEEQKTEPIFSSIRAGLIYLKRSPFILSLMITTVFLNMFLTGPFNIGLPIFARNVLGGDELTYSYLSTGIAVGMLLGTLIVGVLNLKKKRGLISVLSIGALSIFLLLFSLVSTFWLNLVIVLLIGITISLTNVPLAAAIQHHTDKEYLGRIVSLIQFSSMGLVPVSYFITSMVIGVGISVNQVMFFCALILCLLSLIVLIKAKSLREVD